MRILAASDRFGSISSGGAGRLIAAGWPGARAVVVPVGAAGAGFVEAYAEAGAGTVQVLAGAGGLVSVGRTTSGTALRREASAHAPNDLFARSSTGLGRAVATVLAESPPRLYLDLSGPAVHDGGAGVLAALGAVADVPLDRGASGLASATGVDITEPRRRLGRTELVGVVPESELGAGLVGLRGITARLDRRQHPPDRLLAIDAALDTWAQLLGGELGQTPGAGAAGGLGLAVLALGGRLATGPSVTLASVPAGTDLVLTGCPVFDFAGRGGGVVSAVARAATQALAPCVLLAGQVLVGAREMRTMGIEAAYAVRSDRVAGAVEGVELVSETELAALARRVARSWSW